MALFTIFTRYPNHEALFNGLKNEEPQAIQVLAKELEGKMHAIPNFQYLIKEDKEDLLQDIIVTFIKKIRAGIYTYQGNNPCSYCIDIGKNLILRHLKKKQNEDKHIAKDDIDLIAKDYKDETNFDDTVFDIGYLIEKAFQSIGENCRRLLTLKYQEGYTDSDIIAQKLTQYTTVDSLKRHRHPCKNQFKAQYKKLVETLNIKNL